MWILEICGNAPHVNSFFKYFFFKNLEWHHLYLLVRNWIHLLVDFDNWVAVVDMYNNTWHGYFYIDIKWKFTKSGIIMLVAFNIAKRMWLQVKRREHYVSSLKSNCTQNQYGACWMVSQNYLHYYTLLPFSKLSEKLNGDKKILEICGFLRYWSKGAKSVLTKNTRAAWTT